MKPYKRLKRHKSYEQGRVSKQVLQACLQACRCSRSSVSQLVRRPVAQACQSSLQDLTHGQRGQELTVVFLPVPVGRVCRNQSINQQPRSLGPGKERGKRCRDEKLRVPVVCCFSCHNAKVAALGPSALRAGPSRSSAGGTLVTGGGMHVVPWLDECECVRPRLVHCTSSHRRCCGLQQ